MNVGKKDIERNFLGCIISKNKVLVSNYNATNRKLHVNLQSQKI